MKQLYMIGNAHLDPVWLWQWQEGYQEVKATFRSALDRLNEDDGFVFTCACAEYYRWVEENAPGMFSEIGARVAEGRWVIVGGMWIQPDMNVPCGESIVRQMLFSQRYFKEKFGLTVKTGYNVDTFGHNGNLPALLRNAGIENYVWMRPSAKENPSIPSGPMVWEGVDGTRVNAFHIFNEYVGYKDVPGKIAETLAAADEKGLPMMCFYGVGNHGGGPTIKNLREIGAFMRDDPRGSALCYSDPQRYFDALAAAGRPLPLWKGELQHHASGCYSTTASLKRLHRTAENALLRAESFASLSRMLTGHEADKVFTDRAWQNLLFNEFHDIMGGCCIEEAVEDAETQLSETVSIARREENKALQKISWAVDTVKDNPLRVRSKEDDGFLWGIRGQGTPVVVFNPHPFDAVDTVLIRRPAGTVRDDHGTPVPCQKIRSSRTNHTDFFDTVFRAELPALGYRLYWLFAEEENCAPDVDVSERYLDNGILRAEFDPASGALIKLNGLLTGSTSAKLYDITHCDTWAHNVFKFGDCAGSFGGAKIEISERGPVRSAVTVTSHYGESVLKQKYILYAGEDALRVEVTLEMREKQRLLKLCFPAGGESARAEIPYAEIERNANGDEEPCQRWIAMGSLAVINDGKYSYSAADGELRLTVAHTSLYADHYGQSYRDDTCRTMDLGEQRFTYVLAPNDESRCRRAALLNRPAVSVLETYHEGPLPGEARGIRITPANVTAGAVKRAEDGKGYVLRLVETQGREADAKAELPLIGRSVGVHLAPYRVRSVYLPDDETAEPRFILDTEIEE